MKKVIVIMVLIVCSTISLMAATHTVARGETLQSIAAKYNLTTTQLVEANPGADKLFYVGLKLTIPESVATETPTDTHTVSATSTPLTVQPTETQYYQPDTAVDDAPGTEFAMMLEYGFIPKTGNSTNWTYAFTIGANYYFLHKNTGLFAGARIGYNSATFMAHDSDGHGSFQDAELASHFISVPLNIGYALTTANKNLGITPYAGIDVNFCVASKYKQKSYSSGTTTQGEAKYKKKVGLDARIGLQLRLWDFNIGGSYVMPLNKNQEMYFGDDSYFAINIGWGF